METPDRLTLTQIDGERAQRHARDDLVSGEINHTTATWWCMWSDDKQTMERHAVLTDMAVDEAIALRVGTDHVQERSGPRPGPVRDAFTCDRAGDFAGHALSVSSHADAPTEKC